MTITPTGVVLLQELERFNKLLDRIERTLSQLRRALAGEIGMDSILDNIANSLFNGQLPEDWRKLAPQTCKQLGGWIDHLLVRYLRKFYRLNFPILKTVRYYQIFTSPFLLLITLYCSSLLFIILYYSL